MRPDFFTRLPRGVGRGAVLLLVVTSLIAQSRSSVDQLLRDMFSSSQLRELDEGTAVITSLDTPVRQELAHFAAVYVDLPPERFVERFRDIERFEHGPGILQIGRFSAAPGPEDLASLKLPAGDIEALRTCQPGDCKVKLSAEAMRRFRSEVNWASPNPAEQANAVARDVILDLVRAYQQSGNAALGQYDDDSEPFAVAEGFRALLESGDRRPVAVRGLIAYLNDYPRGRPAGAEEFFYWSEVDFGLKPTIRVNHVIIQALSDRPAGVTHVMAIKQLYATHYFRTALELRFLIDDVAQDKGPGFHLVSITRSRSDGMTGLKGLILRPIVNRRSREAVRRYLEHIKQQVERAAAAPAAGRSPGI